ncbi:protein Atp11p, mitochondrial [[Candida] anglica]|uniref:Protein Atp11p, mitochondrial n=1 Tax=[Candida] anglica TaxID=148631 RepID=A0ABP0ECF8_9ASCO
MMLRLLRLPQKRTIFQTIRFNSSLADRYREKLEQKAKELGANTVEELQTKLKDDIDRKKREFNTVDPLQELEEYERRQAQELEKDRKLGKNSDGTIKVRSAISKDTPKLPYKTLASYVDLDKFKDLPNRELEFLWKARFTGKEGTLHAVLTNLQFAQMYVNAFKNPSFILPLPKDGADGYEMHFVQWSFVGPNTTHCMLTTVAEYKLHREYAKPHTTLMFHQDLQESHQVVLMNGQVETEAALSMDEATLLVLNVQRFYGGIGSPEAAARKKELLTAFTKGDDSFDVQELIKEAASME